MTANNNILSHFISQGVFLPLPCWHGTPPPLYPIYPFIQIQIRYYIYFISLSASCKVSNARFTPKSYVMIKYELKNVCRGVQGGPGCTGLLRVGGTHDGVGAHLILHLLAFPFLRQSTFYIAFAICIALTQTKRLSKKIIF